ncbi:MAG TPA: GAF domain-containing protein [Stenomitos sp.]
MPVQLSQSWATVLIVDGSSEDRAAYIQYLRSDANLHLTCHFVEADSLETGLKAWHLHQPDVVFLDLLLPNGEAIELLEALRAVQIDGPLPVIAFFTAGSERLAMQAMRLGVADGLAKEEVTPAALSDAVKLVSNRAVWADRLQQSSQQQAVIMAETALRIRQYLELDEILPAVVEEVRTFLAADRVIIFQFNPDMSGTVVAESVAAPWKSSLRNHIVDTCFQQTHGHAYRAGKIFVADNIESASLSDCHRALLRRFQVKANLVVPILLPNAEDPLWGLLVAHQCATPRHWEAAEVQFLQQLSVQVAIAIQQATLHQNLQALNSALEQQVEQRTSDLVNSEQKFHGLFNHTFQLTALLDLDGRVLDVNQTALKFKGLQYETVLNQPFWEIPWLDISHIAQEQLRATIALAAQGGWVRYALEGLDAGNQWVCLDLSLRPLLDEKQEPYMLIAEAWDVSAAKQTEITLQMQSKMLELINDAVISTDIDGIICSWNQGAQRLYGYTATEAIGRNVAFLYPNPDELQPLLLEPLFAKGTHELEVCVCTKAGELLYISLRLSMMHDEHGQLLRLIGCANDITERKAAEEAIRSSQEALRRSEEFNRLAVEVSNIGAWDLFLADFTCLMSPQMFALMGYPAEQNIVLPSQWQASIWPADRAQVDAALAATIEHDVPLSVEHRICWQDGSVHWLYSCGGLLYNEAGEKERIRGTSIDISDRKAVEYQLQQQTRQKQVIWNVSQAIRQSLDFDAILSSAVTAVRTLLEVDRVAVYRFQADWSGEFIAESVAEGWVKLVGSEVRKIWEDSYLQETQGGRFRHNETMIVNDIYEAGLQPCHVDLLEQFQARSYAIAPINYGDQLWGLFALYRNDAPYTWTTWDIELLQQTASQLAIAIQQSNLLQQVQQQLSERELAQQLLTQRNEELARATRLKDEFLANMSHELRTPLNAILGMTEGLTEKVFGSINDRQQKALATVNSSAMHLLDLINDILDVAKIESGHIQLECASTPVTPLCLSSLTFVKQQAFQKRIQIETHIPNGLPNLWVDERRTRQVLINLLNNAVKFTPPEGRITLDIKQPEDGFLRIAITDTGIGIDPDKISTLFQPFVQIDSALNREYQGTGLGLVLVKRIVELHGGQVELTSQVGVGSCFVIYLPCVEGLDGLRSGWTDESGIVQDTLPMAGGTMPLILLAEDNEANIATMSTYLIAKGFQVIVAHNGQEAIDVAKAEHPDLILMDIQMPKVDGIEAIQTLRSDPAFKEVPIIALTALAMEADKARCLQAGATGYLSKPVKLKHLATTIQSLVPT